MRLIAGLPILGCRDPAEYRTLPAVSLNIRQQLLLPSSYFVGPMVGSHGRQRQLDDNSGCQRFIASKPNWWRGRLAHLAIASIPRSMATIRLAWGFSGRLAENCLLDATLRIFLSMIRRRSDALPLTECPWPC